MSCQWGWGGVGFAAKTVKCGPVCGVGVGWCLLQRLLCVVLSGEVLGWGFCNTDHVTSCLWGWSGVVFATKTVLPVVLSGGVCNTDRVRCRPVCGVGVVWG